MKKPLIIHPLLFVLFPFLFFYAHNIQEMHTLTLRQTLLLLVFFLGLALLVWFLHTLLFKDRMKAALATTIAVIVVLAYGRFYELLGHWGFFVPGHSYLLPAVLAGVGYCFYRLRKTRRDFRTATQALNAAAAVLTMMNIFAIVHYEVTAAQMVASLADDRAAHVIQPETNATPDIYYIILDEYGHPDTMREHYNYDNEHFLNYLEERGFFIARDSIAHNERTVRCIASILNMEHTCETEPRPVTIERISDNKVMNYFESIGYDIVYFGHYSELDRYEIHADKYINYYEDSEYSPFTVQFTNFILDSNLARPLHSHIADEDYVRYHRRALSRTLEHLSKTPALESPKFVYAHFMMPHTPFVFGPEGEHVPPEHMYNCDDKEYYLGQYVYTTEQITGVIDELLDQSETEPVIILQSDHGPRWLDGWEQILNAFYLPDGGEELVHDAISPVDTFRVIFNHYFDAGLEPEAEPLPSER